MSDVPFEGGMVGNILSHPCFTGGKNRCWRRLRPEPRSRAQRGLGCTPHHGCFLNQHLAHTGQVCAAPLPQSCHRWPLAGGHLPSQHCLGSSQPRASPSQRDWERTHHKALRVVGVQESHWWPTEGRHVSRSGWMGTAFE